MVCPGQTMPGTIVRSGTHGLTDVVSLATQSASNFALMVINYGATAYTASVALVGAGAKLYRWEQSQTYLNGHEMAISASALRAQPLPAESIIIYHS
jgi:hypothetical protein